VLFALFLASVLASSLDLLALALGVLLAALTVLAIAWVTSMVAGPFVLVKLRNRPDTLGVWTTIVLPLSLAFALVCAVAIPLQWTEGCVRQKAVAPLFSVPVFLLKSEDRAPVAYVRFDDDRVCS
jgi:hypothetical protein